MCSALSAAICTGKCAPLGSRRPAARTRKRSRHESRQMLDSLSLRQPALEDLILGKFVQAKRYRARTGERGLRNESDDFAVQDVDPGFRGFGDDAIENKLNR